MYGNTFKDCKAVADISVAAGSAYKAVNNAIIDPEKTLVYLAGQAKEIKLADSECTAIGDYAMHNNTNVTKVDLHGVKTIGKNSFTGCSALSELLVPNLVSVSTDSYITWSGVASLTTVDIHLSKDFVSFGATEFADKTSTTIYVADENVKSKLEKKFNKCKIVIGEPQSAEKFVVNYSITNIEVGGKKIGEIEAWTDGARDFETGAEIPAGNSVSVMVTPYGGYKIDKWEINGKPAAAENIRPSSSINGEIWSINHISEALNITATLKAEEEGDMIFFKSKEPEFGDITCTVVEKGKQIKNTEKVKKGTKLRFEAFPKEGFHVTQWYKLGTEVVVDENGKKQTVDKYIPIPGYDNATVYECNAVDALDILVDFDREAGKHIVRFKSLNTEGGEVTASVDGKEIKNCAVVAKGATVVFAAHPKEGYVVDSWLLNEEEVKGEKGLTYTITDLKEDIKVWLICSVKSEEPDSKPEIKNGHLISWQPKGKAVTPDGVEYIDNNALQASTALESFHITKSVKRRIGVLVLHTAHRNYGRPRERILYFGRRRIVQQRQNTSDGLSSGTFGRLIRNHSERNEHQTRCIDVGSVAFGRNRGKGQHRFESQQGRTLHKKYVGVALLSNNSAGRSRHRQDCTERRFGEDCTLRLGIQPHRNRNYIACIVEDNRRKRTLKQP